MTSRAEGQGPEDASPAPTEASYGALVKRRRFWLALVGVALLACLFLDLLTGPAFLAPGAVLGALLGLSSADPVTMVIVQDIRLPMTLMALLVGMALGSAGALMQTILANPLASPYTLGFSAAAGFGASVAIFTGVSLPFLPGLTVPLAAFVAALVATALVYGFSSMARMSPEVMILAGIATLFLFQSLQSLVQYLAAPEVLQAIVFWLFGSLLKASWDNLPIVAVITASCLAALLPDLWKLTALRLGEERARAIGVNVRGLRTKVFVLVAFLTAGAVAFVGTIGFVGLVAPHVARMLVGEDQRSLLPLSAIVGGLIMTAASVLSKLVSPGAVVPIGIVTAVVGVPFLFALILSGRRRHW